MKNDKGGHMAKRNAAKKGGAGNGGSVEPAALTNTQKIVRVVQLKERMRVMDDMVKSILQAKTQVALLLAKYQAELRDAGKEVLKKSTTKA